MQCPLIAIDRGVDRTRLTVDVMKINRAKPLAADGRTAQTRHTLVHCHMVLCRISIGCWDCQSRQGKTNEVHAGVRYAKIMPVIGK